jgi:hypothetical protein
MHHVDVHVSNLRRTRPLLDAIFQCVHYAIRSEDDTIVSYWKNGVRPSIVFEEGGCVGGSTRLAFAVATRDEVDTAARVAASHGACNIEGPAIHPEYGDYYAVFFEDEDGNLYEVVHDPDTAS